ncbi:hypothetical protein KO528_00815 [Saccharophagus degradans]|uniref:Phytanoyl-CoA dioxygenase n=1 Tax=Saccharophagus degradans TaxID=86304 RepID=A0AAW7X3C7_9GAMM|nr:hypothetical protein [Saccharophagus degradans]MBU2983878.1 hypothetical protein [Saccharophagus degradans]MDO6422148.1 hypothetical protein [Saccharophagus degradans]MDO6607577.1 hypothetical protein [Saccharophagus degradans]
MPINIIRYIRRTKSNENYYTPSLLGDINPMEIAEQIRTQSLYHSGLLPKELVERITKVTDNLPYNEYKLVHQVNEDILRITTDDGIQRVLRAYFKCTPELLEASLFVSKPEKDEENKGQNSFHFDYGGWDSLNILVYLTDVTHNSSYHVIIKGSHKDIGFREIINRTITEEEAQKRYAENIQEITGPAGTIFFENTEAFHRRHKGNERRVLLNLLFASHRSWLSYGRASKKDLAIRNYEFARCTAEIGT